MNDSPNYVWENNLKAIKQVLKEWAKNNFIPPYKEK
jgi:hypothetical protein